VDELLNVNMKNPDVAIQTLWLLVMNCERNGAIDPTLFQKLFVDYLLARETVQLFATDVHLGHFRKLLKSYAISLYASTPKSSKKSKMVPPRIAVPLRVVLGVRHLNRTRHCGNG